METEGRTKSMYLFVGLLANKSAIKDSDHDAMGEDKDWNLYENKANPE